jgi:hypothetical protein
LEDGGGGVGIEDVDAFDTAASGFDFGAANDLITGPIATFNENIGDEGGDDFLGSRLVKDENRVDTLEAGKNFGALLLRNDGTAGPLEGANAGVAVDADDEEIAEGAGRFEAANVAGMQKIEAAIGEDEFAAVAFLASKPHNRLFQSQDRRMQRNSMFIRMRCADWRTEASVYHGALTPRWDGRLSL